jgi:hypothetical protein
MDSSMFERRVRPRKEDEDLDVSSAASAEEETSDNEDEGALLDLSDAPDSKSEPEGHDEDVPFFTLRSLRYISN